MIRLTKRIQILRVLILFLIFPIGQVFSEDESVSTDQPPFTDAVAVVSSDTAADTGISTGEAFVLKLQEGGWTMAFLLVCSVITTGCTIERIVKQRKSNIAPDGLAERVESLWAQGKFDELENMLHGEKSTLGRIFTAIVKYRHNSSERVSMIAGDLAARDLKRHLQSAFPLAVVATIAPLLGLFGTVIGMIGAFDQIALLGELADPSAFGGDIGKALITTGAGLAVAIAALSLYHWFKSRISVYGLELEEQVSMLITDWFDNVEQNRSRTGVADAN